MVMLKFLVILAIAAGHGRAVYHDGQRARVPAGFLFDDVKYDMQMVQLMEAEHGLFTKNMETREFSKYILNEKQGQTDYDQWTPDDCLRDLRHMWDTAIEGSG